MIRINLLPFRAARKREDIRRQVSISGLLLLLVFVVLVVWFIAINNNASDLKNQQASKTAELDGYKKELEELKNLEKMIKETQTKLDVIKELEKGKTGPVLLLSAIADAVPANKLWLTSLKEGNGASDLKNQEASKTAELEGYKKELEELKNLEKMIKETQTKLDVIKELEKGKTGPVLLLSAIADAVPANKLWLTSLKEGNGTLTLTGTAMDNETVALFMNNLEASKDVISAVELKSATGKEIPQYKLKVSDFALECKTYAYKTEKKKAASKPKGK